MRKAMEVTISDCELRSYYLEPQRGCEISQFFTPDGGSFDDAEWDELYAFLIPEARGEVLIAATDAGMAFDVTGLGIAHAIGHALGETAGVHHGPAVALALNATMANGAQAAPDAYAQVAEALGVDTRGMAPHEAAAAAPAAYDAWLREVGLKLSLVDHGLGAGDAARIAALCAEPANKTIMDNDSFAYTSEAIEAAVARLLAAA